MPNITYIEHSGTSHTVDVAEGMTVMEGAVQNNIPGIVAECGGACSCSTCHAYIDSAWFAQLPQPDENEADMLDFAIDPIEGRSRLTCQIKIHSSLEGLVVQLPENQP